MSWEALAWAKQQRGLGTARKLLLLLLAEKSGSTNSCYPSVGRLAEEMECSERTVQRLLGDLDRRGLISRKNRFRATTIYTLNLGVILSPQPDVTVEPCHPRGDKIEGRGDSQSVTSEVTARVSPEYSLEHQYLNHQKNTQRARERATASATAAATHRETQTLFQVAVVPPEPAPEPPGFADFYAVYPKKVEKIAARKSWDKTIKNGADPLRVIEAARKYAEAVRETERRYIKGPAVWLNKGCYDDEELPQPARQGFTNPTDQSLYDVQLGASDPWKDYM